MASIHQEATLINKQAKAELGKAQLKLELELRITKFKICCIKLIKGSMRIKKCPKKPLSNIQSGYSDFEKAAPKNILKSKEEHQNQSPQWAIS